MSDGKIKHAKFETKRKKVKDKVSGEKLIRLGHSQARISAMKNPGLFNSRKDQRNIGEAAAQNLMEGAKRKTLAKKRKK